MEKFFTIKKDIQVSNRFEISYTEISPLNSNSYTYNEFLKNVKLKNKSNILFKQKNIYIINKIKPNKTQKPITPNTIFKITSQNLQSLNTKNDHLKYLKKEEKYSYFNEEKKLQILKIKNIKLI